MPTNQQRRATAKRKLERQLERRAKQAKRRRQLMIIGAGVAAVAVIAAIVTVVVLNKQDHKSNTASTTSSATPTNPLAPPLPSFKAPANLGADCQYPKSQQPAAKPVQPPRTGKVPTDPATVSISMVTSQGHIGLLLANNKSPCTVNSFVSLATQKFFNDTKCHRLTTEPELAVLQCGNAKDGGLDGGPGYQFANEYPTDQFPPNDPKLDQPVLYPRGTLAMANTGAPSSNASEFFMVYRDSVLPPNYTVFGTVQADGLATLDKIAKAGVVGGGPEGKPVAETVITSVLPD